MGELGRRIALVEDANIYKRNRIFLDERRAPLLSKVATDSFMSMQPSRARCPLQSVKSKRVPKNRPGFIPTMFSRTD